MDKPIMTNDQIKHLVDLNERLAYATAEYLGLMETARIQYTMMTHFQENNLDTRDLHIMTKTNPLDEMPPTPDFRVGQTLASRIIANAFQARYMRMLELMNEQQQFMKEIGGA